MKQKLILFLIGIFVFSISCQNQKAKKGEEPKEEVAAVVADDPSPELHSISEIKAVFELADVGFYPEIVNDPLKALKYEGDRKIAANIGVYMADLIYVMTTSGRQNAYTNYGAIMELSKNVGLTDDIPRLILERYENGTTSVDEVQAMIEKALNDSKKNLSENKKAEFYAYMIMGNYIEKLYVVSSIIKRPKKTELPAEVEASLKRGLLKYVSKQSGRLQEVVNLLSSYQGDSKDIIVRNEIESLMNSYKAVEAKRAELLALPPGDVYNAEEVVTIFNQIESIRNRIVE